MKHNSGEWNINGIHLEIESITEKQGKDVEIVLRMVEDKDSRVTETNQVMSPYLADF